MKEIKNDEYVDLDLLKKYLDILEIPEFLRFLNLIKDSSKDQLVDYFIDFKLENNLKHLWYDFYINKENGDLFYLESETLFELDQKDIEDIMYKEFIPSLTKVEY